MELRLILGFDSTRVLDELEWGRAHLEKELDNLSSACDHFTDEKMEDVNKHFERDMSGYIQEAKALSPHMFSLIRQLVDLYGSQPEQKDVRTIAILSQMCYTRSVKLANSCFQFTTWMISGLLIPIASVATTMRWIDSERTNSWETRPFISSNSSEW
jgi:hypothetical protein